MLYRFCSNFHTLYSIARIFKNWLRLDRVIASLKVGTFLRHSVELSGILQLSVGADQKVKRCRFNR